MLFNERRENLFKENIPAFKVQGKSQFFRFAEKSGDNHPKNYVTFSLVLRKCTFGVICTKMLQIQRKTCFKVNNFFFYRSLKKRNVLYIIILPEGGGGILF